MLSVATAADPLCRSLPHRHLFLFFVHSFLHSFPALAFVAFNTFFCAASRIGAAFNTFFRILLLHLQSLSFSCISPASSDLLLFILPAPAAVFSASAPSPAPSCTKRGYQHPSFVYQQFFGFFPQYAVGYQHISSFFNRFINNSQAHVPSFARFPYTSSRRTLRLYFFPGLAPWHCIPRVAFSRAVARTSCHDFS